MIALDLALGAFRTGGRARALAVAACTSVVTALLLLAVSVARYSTDGVVEQLPGGGRRINAGPGSQVANLLLDSGVRPGYFFALLLICLVPLTLLQQVVRLGTAARERRLAALRLAGATPGQVRVVGAWEVGLPALAGGGLGVLVHLVLGSVLGTSAPLGWIGDPEVARELRLVPDDGPGGWQGVVVVLVVGLLGALVGLLASRGVVVSPLGVSRRGRRPPPRGWLPAALVAAGLVVGGGAVAPSLGREWAELGLMAGIGLLVVGLLTATPWVAYRAGGLAAGRTSSPALLLASRWLVADARSAGRAAAAIGVIALVAGGASTTVASLLVDSRDNDHGVDAIYAVPVALVFVVVLAALVVATFSIVVHGVESLTDRRRSLASLSAEGTPLEVLERAVRWEVTLAAVPTAALALTGVGFFSGTTTSGDPLALVISLSIMAATLALTWVSLLVSTRLVRPWLRRAVDPTSLRTT